MQIGIFSDIDRPLEFNETLVSGSVLNVVSIINIRFIFLRKSLLKKLSAFKLFISYVIVKKMTLWFFISIAWFKKLFE